MDMNDLLGETLDAIEGNPDVRDRVSQRLLLANRGGLPDGVKDTLISDAVIDARSIVDSGVKANSLVNVYLAAASSL